jgi:hypothetical protein
MELNEKKRIKVRGNRIYERQEGKPAFVFEVSPEDIPKVRHLRDKVTAEQKYEIDIAVISEFSHESDELSRVDPSEQQKYKINKKLEIIDRIVARGSEISADDFKEMYKIGDRLEDDWGNED